MSASLISPAEVSSIAFVNALDPALILPLFVSSAQTKYIVPLITQPVLDKIDAAPVDYTILVNDYIKPYLAFSVKYMFYNQLLTETDTFPTSDAQRTAAIQEVLAIMEVSRGLLSDYLNANVFETPVVPVKNLTAGFLKSKGQLLTAISNSDVTSTLAGASTGIPSDPDTFNFINFATGLLNKITWINLVNLLKSAADMLYASVNHSHSEFQNQFDSEIDQPVTEYIDNRLMSVTELQPVPRSESELWQCVSCDYLGNVILAGVAGTGGGRLYLSVDGGINWTEQQPAGDVDTQWMSVAVERENGTLFAACMPNGKLYRSLDKETWSEIQPYTPNNPSWHFIVCATDSGLVLAGALYGRLYLSADLGDNFTEVQPAGNLDCLWFTGAVSDNGQYLLASNFITNGGSQTFLSDNNGVTWTDISFLISDDPSERIVSASINYDGSVIALSSNMKAYVSTDFGNEFNSITNHVNCPAIAVNANPETPSLAFVTDTFLNTSIAGPDHNILSHRIRAITQPQALAMSVWGNTYFVANFAGKLLKIVFKEFAVLESSPASGTFISSDSKTVTVTSGIITSITA